MDTTESKPAQVGAQDVVPKHRQKPLSEADVDRAVAEAFAAAFRRGVFAPGASS